MNCHLQKDPVDRESVLDVELDQAMVKQLEGGQRDIIAALAVE